MSRTEDVTQVVGAMSSVGQTNAWLYFPDENLLLDTPNCEQMIAEPNWLFAVMFGYPITKIFLSQGGDISHSPEYSKAMAEYWGNIPDEERNPNTAFARPEFWAFVYGRLTKAK
jgi:hypothetical protein